MIREKFPIVLIPAAWAMTFITVVYPEINPYWIRHMHYFMLLFLGGFTIVSWSEMKADKVLEIWRNIIAIGFLATLSGAIGFSLPNFNQVTFWISLSYWFMAPVIGIYLSSRYMDEYSDLYLKLGVIGISSFPVFVLGILSGYKFISSLGILLTGFSQTLSILKASDLDN